MENENNNRQRISEPLPAPLKNRKFIEWQSKSVKNWNETIEYKTLLFPTGVNKKKVPITIQVCVCVTQTPCIIALYKLPENQRKTFSARKSLKNSGSLLILDRCAWVTEILQRYQTWWHFLFSLSLSRLIAAVAVDVVIVVVIHSVSY